MIRRTLTCAALAVTLVLATAPIAGAANYAGKGIDDPRVRVDFERERGKVRGFTFERAKFSCTNGERFRARMRVGRMRVTEGKRFRGHFMSADRKAAVRVRGRFVRGRAQGSLRALAYLEADKCVTAGVKWRARRTASD